MPEIIGQLIAQPGLGGAESRLLKADRHVGGNPVVAVQDFRERPARNAKPLRRGILIWIAVPTKLASSTPLERGDASVRQGRSKAPVRSVTWIT